MSLSRRDFLKLGGLTAATLTVSACGVAGRRMAHNGLPESLLPPTPLPPDSPTTAAAPGRPTVPVNPVVRLLNRAGYGPRPGDPARAAAIGLAAYLEEQLHPERIDDAAADLIIRNFTYYPMEVGQLIDQEQRDLAEEVGLSTLGRAVYSKRQLYEAMVEFWSDHFNVYVRKNEAMLALKIVDDRDIIRPHALGKFRDLLFASAGSPAMLVYLDNVLNVRGQPNENYARELMELHTLGVHGGYTQRDVQELARALTGWSVARRGPDQGQFRFNANQHDTGEKVVLGRHLPAGRGQEDLLDVLEILATHPATARFLATKLVRRFVADDPPASLVERVAQTYLDSDGDIKSLLRVIFLSDEFAAAPPKLKRPYTFLVSALRAFHGDLSHARAVGRWLNMMGQPPFLWPPPDGYPDVASAWVANLLPRWSFALALLTDQVPGASLPFDDLLHAGQAADAAAALDVLAGLVLVHPLDDEARDLFAAYTGPGRLGDRETDLRLREAAALMLASPAFQWT